MLNPNSMLSDFIHQWLFQREAEVKPATFNRLFTSWTALNGFGIAQMPVASITKPAYMNYVKELVDAEYAISTIKKQMLIVSAPMRYAYENGIIPMNPCLGVKPPKSVYVKKQSRDVEAYTPSEQDRIRNAITLDEQAHTGYAVINLIMETGLRIGEALALKWRDVSIERRRLNVHATVVNISNRRTSYVQDDAKSSSSNRVIPLSLNAVQILTDQFQKTGGMQWVFATPEGCNRGERLSYEAMRYQGKCLCNAAGVPYRGLHVYRHTFATNQYYKGTDVKILSKILGHATPSITYNIYVHLYGDGFNDMLRAMD